MPSFDVVSDFNYHEVTNAVDQSNREITTRFDFKGTNSNFSLEENSINLTSESEFQLQQMLDILKQKLAKRGVNIGCLEAETTVGGFSAIIPSIEGWARVYGHNSITIDERDPLSHGFLLA